MMYPRRARVLAQVPGANIRQLCLATAYKWLARSSGGRWLAGSKPSATAPRQTPPAVEAQVPCASLSRRGAAVKSTTISAPTASRGCRVPVLSPLFSVGRVCCPPTRRRPRPRGAGLKPTRPPPLRFISGQIARTDRPTVLIQSRSRDALVAAETSGHPRQTITPKHWARTNGSKEHGYAYDDLLRYRPPSATSPTPNAPLIAGGLTTTPNDPTKPSTWPCPPTATSSATTHYQRRPADCLALGYQRLPPSREMNKAYASYFKEQFTGAGLHRRGTDRL